MSLVNFLDLREKIFLIEFCGGGLTPNDRVFFKGGSENQGSKRIEYLTIGAEESERWQKRSWMDRERQDDALDDPSSW
jgi:hypothetical protein